MEVRIEIDVREVSNALPLLNCLHESVPKENKYTCAKQIGLIRKEKTRQLSNQNICSPTNICTPYHLQLALVDATKRSDLLGAVITAFEL